jgi:hypothetical protein
VSDCDHTWSPTHPHANDRQWQSRGWTGRLVTWAWATCKCGAKTAVAVGIEGDPTCDECFDAMAEAWDEADAAKRPTSSKGDPKTP